MRQGAKRAPGSPGVSETQEKENKIGEPPKLILAFFELLEARGKGGAAGLFGRRALLAALRVLVFIVH